ncbi:hypothetical protein J1614_012222 [Plenodomus biglobosus]|nr:hypothetical protein J1614_012222 [Plenodomus biglobosus]
MVNVPFGEKSYLTAKARITFTACGPTDTKYYGKYLVKKVYKCLNACRSIEALLICEEDHGEQQL